MKRLILVRHAQTDWNIEERCHGITDVPLGNYGTKMAASLIDQITEIDIDEVYCSDLQRARMTMEIILNGRNIPVRYEVDFRERNFGKMEGHTHSQGLELWPEEVSIWLKDHKYTMEGGETFDEFTARVEKCFKSILSHTENKTVMIVAHGGSLQAILQYLTDTYPVEGADLWITHACYSDIVLENGKLIVQKSNYCEHLATLQ